MTTCISLLSNRQWKRTENSAGKNLKPIHCRFECNNTRCEQLRNQKPGYISSSNGYLLNSIWCIPASPYLPFAWEDGFFSPRSPASLSGNLTARRTEIDERRKRNKENDKTNPIFQNQPRNTRDQNILTVLSTSSRNKTEIDRTGHKQENTNSERQTRVRNEWDTH